MNHNKNNIVSILLIIFVFFNFYFFNFAHSAGAKKQTSAIDNVQTDINNSATTLGYNTGATMTDTAVTIINTAFSFLGIIFLILIIISGLQWMMAGGNEETISKAKNRIKNSVYGLAIVLVAYALTWITFRYI
ncbi:MAG: hypothetical protein PHH83_03060, partial [Patescibacteria group bacterium]|nr:hypothetical protein [Patescibacteria group bacterium]